jgi:competence protein CoiA
MSFLLTQSRLGLFGNASFFFKRIRMKFALVNGQKVEASKGTNGFCQNCGAEMIAKCGEFKVSHWAHRRIRQCDTWWETETEWHRKWKGKFPDNWQEVVHFDETTGEKHIADVRTDKGLVIEFQHSHITPLERRQREDFYKNMIWIVDGTRLQRDFPRFIKARNDCVNIDNPMIFGIEFADECFPRNWLDSNVPVIFDFLGVATMDSNGIGKELLYCIFPVKLGWLTVFAEISRNALVKSIISGEWQNRCKMFVDDLTDRNRVSAQREKFELEKRQAQAAFEFNQRLLGRVYTGGRRRF